MGEQHTPTPGPWTTRADGWQPWEGAIQILGPDGQIIAYTSAGTNAKADAPLLAAAPDLLKALEKIEKWFGEFPDTERFWDKNKTDPMSYSAAFGSNGERDFMRTIAREALAKVGQP